MASKQKPGKEKRKPKKHTAEKKVVPVDFMQSIVKKGWHVRGAA